jgi:hypothetical protein
MHDSGFTEVVNEASLGGDEGAYNTPYILDPQNSAEMLVGTCRVWQITTTGTSPLQLSNDFDTLGTGLCTGNEINLATALTAGGPTNSSGYLQVVYAVTNGFGPLSGSPGGEVWVTTNAGVSLMTNVTQNEAQNINPNGYAISSVALDSSDATGNTAYVGIMGFSTPGFPTSHVWQTKNAGLNWTDWTGTGLPDSPVNALLVDVSAAQVYAGTDVGVFVSPTSAPNWTEVGPAPGPGVSGFLPNAPVTALQLFNPDGGTKTLVASTYGRGIWNFALAVLPSFTNVITNSPQTIFPTQSAIFNGTLTAQNGYNSPVNLSCSGAIPANCELQPTRAQFTGATATYTLTAGGSVNDYSFNAHAVGTDANAITRDASLTLHVVDFNLSAPNPNSLTVGQGGTSSASKFQVTAAGSFAGTVALSCPSGLPSGARCVFSPSASVNPTSTSPVPVTLTVTAEPGTPAVGPVTVTIAAITAGAPAAKKQTFSLTVTQATPDFAIVVVATPNTTVANQNVTWNGTLTALNGYSGTVSLSCTSGAPASCAISPPTLTPTTTGAQFTVTLGSAAAGAFSFTIQGTDGTLTHATPAETLTVGTDVAWTNTGSASVTVLAGQSASFTYTATPVGDVAFSSAVTLQCVNLPAMTGCQFSPAAIAAGAAATAVALTITTIGPNSGTESRPQAMPRAALMADGGGPSSRLGSARILPFFTLVWLVMIGMIGMGQPIRARRLRGVAARICLGLGLIAEISCGGVGGGGGGNPPPVTVTVSPTSGTVFYAKESQLWPAGVTQQLFKATVNGSSNQSVTWSVDPGNGNGSVDGNGLYSAPTAVPNPATVSVTATSALAQSPGTGFVNLVAATPLGTSQITAAATAAGGTAHGNVLTLTVQ